VRHEDALTGACESDHEEQSGQVYVDDQSDLAVAGVAFECDLHHQADAARVRLVHDRDDGREGPVVGSR
jgi:hypothetical protein